MPWNFQGGNENYLRENKNYLRDSENYLIGKFLRSYRIVGLTRQIVFLSCLQIFRQTPDRYFFLNFRKILRGRRVNDCKGRLHALRGEWPRDYNILHSACQPFFMILYFCNTLRGKRNWIKNKWDGLRRRKEGRFAKRPPCALNSKNIQSTIYRAFCKTPLLCPSNI